MTIASLPSRPYALARHTVSRVTPAAHPSAIRRTPAQPSATRPPVAPPRPPAPYYPPRATRQPLSPREAEVLAYVAEGLTDAQIARRLQLSPRTVSKHLQRVYAKLAVANRVAALRSAGILGPAA